MREVDRVRTPGRRPRRASVLRSVSVDRDRSVPPGRQLERQVAAMVREGRLEPGRRLPSTRRLAPAVGLHRNTVAAAYRRLADSELLEMRHGARARVAPTPDGDVGGPVDGVLAAGGDEGTARLMAAELRAVLPRRIHVEPAATCTHAGRASGGRWLVAALPGPALPRVASAPSRRLRQDRRGRIREALRRAPRLAVVVVATESPVLREAVLSDAARIRRRDLSLIPPSGPRARRRDGTVGSAAAADLVIADRLAADAFCESSTSPSAVLRARLVCRDSLAALARGVGGPCA